MLSSFQSCCTVLPLPNLRRKSVVADQLGRICIALFLFVSRPTFSGNTNICSKVASTTLKTCESDIQDDYWIQQVKCQKTKYIVKGQVSIVSPKFQT